MNPHTSRRKIKSNSKTMPLLRARLARGFTWIELLVAILIIAAEVYLLILGPAMSHLGCTVRSKGSRAKADHRSLATAIESYYIDEHAYPAQRPLGSALNSKKDLKALRKIGGGELSGIEWGRGESLHGLTTPVAYISTPFPDPYSKFSAFPYAYYTDGAGWIVFSPGPDGVYDITNPAAVYDSTKTTPSQALIQLTYDPTNGAKSKGDIYRVKQ